MCKKNEREDVIGKQILKRSGRKGDGLWRGKEERGTLTSGVEELGSERLR
jgi:hypothetical protein